MYINRNINFKVFLQKAYKPLLFLALYGALIVVLYEYFHMTWIKLPWSILSIVGTAVAFYVGFKNNSAYARTWEARKIWGAIINSSRSWGIFARDFTSNLFVDKPLDENELYQIHKDLILRHIGWAYRLRRQLWKPQPWEHSHQLSNEMRKRLGDTFASLSEEEELKLFIEEQEANDLLKKRNVCTQIISNQSQKILELREKGLIDDFRHMEMQKLLKDFYIQQGKCERIKNFPLPRQYANTSFVLTVLIVILLPFGMVSQFSAMGQGLVWLTIPFTTIVGSIYFIMEFVGDFAENPFEGLAFDTPMTSLCNTIEIDLKEMLGKEELPEKVKPHDNVLM
ncbi:bestrophin family protein [Flammeovirga sp. OC4]|uniref:bestrophin family protein n=1 Tax=Flammeovirga sp. OC4 TaxID=1382345 RepID=UPI0005C64E95|nr:bestrophin family ion channel [Flammeovirga sp. OC4]